MSQKVDDPLVKGEKIPEDLANVDPVIRLQQAVANKLEADRKARAPKAPTQ